MVTRSTLQNKCRSLKGWSASMPIGKLTRFYFGRKEDAETMEEYALDRGHATSCSSRGDAWSVDVEWEKP